MTRDVINATSVKHLNDKTWEEIFTRHLSEFRQIPWMLPNNCPYYFLDRKVKIVNPQPITDVVSTAKELTLNLFYSVQLMIPCDIFHYFQDKMVGEHFMSDILNCRVEVEDETTKEILTFNVIMKQQLDSPMLNMIGKMSKPFLQESFFYTQIAPLFQEEVQSPYKAYEPLFCANYLLMIPNSHKVHKISFPVERYDCNMLSWDSLPMIPMCPIHLPVTATTQCCVGAGVALQKMVSSSFKMSQNFHSKMEFHLLK